MRHGHGGGFEIKVWQRSPRDWPWSARDTVRRDVFASGTETNRTKARDAAIVAVSNKRKEQNSPWMPV